MFLSQKLAMAVFLSGLLLAGCETVGKARKDQSMNTRLKEYAHEVRWGTLEALPSYLSPDLMDTQEPVAKDPSNVRVTSYEVLRNPMPAGENQIVQTVKIEYLFRDRQVVRNLVDQQKWEFNPENNDWVRINHIPAFK